MVPRRSAALLLLDCSAGLAWSAMRCTVWRGSVTVAHPCTLIYLIIIGGCAELYSVQRGGSIWYVLDVLQRCAGGIIAACIGLLFAAVEWVKSHGKPL